MKVKLDLENNKEAHLSLFPAHRLCVGLGVDRSRSDNTQVVGRFSHLKLFTSTYSTHTSAGRFSVAISTRNCGLQSFSPKHLPFSPLLWPVFCLLNLVSSSLTTATHLL